MVKTLKALFANAMSMFTGVFPVLKTPPERGLIQELFQRPCCELPTG